MYCRKSAPRVSGAVLIICVFLAGAASAAESIKGQVIGGGAPIARSTVTLWEASAGSPKQLAQTKTRDDGQFEVHDKGARGDSILYLVAAGGVPRPAKRAVTTLLSCYWRFWAAILPPA